MSKSFVEHLEMQCEPKKIRTEEEILKDFEKLGLIHAYIEDDETPYKVLILEDEDAESIEIALYLKEIMVSDCMSINLEKLKLLIELFKCWGWLDEEKD